MVVPPRILSARVPSDLVHALDGVARGRGITRNALIRRSLEAAVEGRVTLLSEEEERDRKVRRLLEVTCDH